MGETNLFYKPMSLNIIDIFNDPIEFPLMGFGLPRLHIHLSSQIRVSESAIVAATFLISISSISYHRIVYPEYP